MTDVFSAMEGAWISQVTPPHQYLPPRVKAVLDKHYPGWRWVIEIPYRQVVVIISNLSVDDTLKGCMSQNITKLDPDLKTIVMAAGEFLERADQRRGSAPEEPVSNIRLDLS